MASSPNKTNKKEMAVEFSSGGASDGPKNEGGHVPNGVDEESNGPNSALDSSHAGTSTGSTSSNEHEDHAAAFAKKENRNVLRSKILVSVVLLLATAVVSFFTYYFMSKEEKDDFESQVRHARFQISQNSLCYFAASLSHLSIPPCHISYRLGCSSSTFRLRSFKAQTHTHWSFLGNWCPYPTQSLLSHTPLGWIPLGQTLPSRTLTF